jgi:hypothetical protein
MSIPEEERGLELHMFAHERNDGLAELLTVMAHYHRTGTLLKVGDTVNFGRPWWDGSIAQHGLISLPYLDGPLLEWLPIGDRRIQFLWVIPVTEKEIQYKKQYGLENLEQALERKRVDYLDPKRTSVV